MKRLLLILSLLGPLLLPAGPVRAASPARVSEAAMGFSIVPPPGWSRIPPNDQAFMIFRDQLRQNYYANFIVNVSADDGMPLQLMASKLKQAQAAQYQNWQLVGEGGLMIDGQEAYLIGTRFSLQGYQLQQLQYYIRGRNKKFFVLIFTAPVAGFEGVEPICRQSAQSVQLR